MGARRDSGDGHDRQCGAPGSRCVVLVGIGVVVARRCCRCIDVDIFLYTGDSQKRAGVAATRSYFTGLGSLDLYI